MNPGFPDYLRWAMGWWNAAPRAAPAPVRPPAWTASAGPGFANPDVSTGWSGTPPQVPDGQTAAPGP